MIYAVGDIHGCSDLLVKMRERIMSDMDGTDNVVVYLGDYVDRGADSFGVVEQLTCDPLPCREVFLRGNHEVFLDAFLNHPNGQGTDIWLRCGGFQTLKSYGVSPTGNPEIIKDDLLDAMPSWHVDFFHDLVPFHESEKYFFCHAGVRPGVALMDQDDDDLYWIRYDFMDHAGLFEKRIVHGHTVVPEVQVMPNRISVDTGAYESGTLSGVALDEDTDVVRILEVC